MNKIFSIGDVQISRNTRPKIIAELGINHEGNIELAKKMARLAIDHGADIVKNQSHCPDKEMSVEAMHAIPGNATKSIYDVISENSLTFDEERELKDFVEERGGTFLSTPFSRESAIHLHELNVSGFKIGSGECNHLPFLDYVSSFGRPILLSTGMNDINSVKTSAEILKGRNIPFALMHTTNLYPTPSRLLRLGGLTELIDEFPELEIGLSDHSDSNSACIAASALGASVLERHFTDSRDRKGPDIKCSMTPEDLEHLRTESEKMFLAKGGKKEILEEERVTANFAFSSVCATQYISKGQKISASMIWPMRPSGGDYGPNEMSLVLGKRAKTDIQPRTQIKSTMLEI